MQLQVFILDHIEAILNGWEKFARTLPPALKLDTVGLRDDAEQIVKIIAEHMKRPDSSAAAPEIHWQEPPGPYPEESPAQAHARARLAIGFNINHLVAEYTALRASVTRLWLAETGETDSSAVRQLALFNDAVDEELREAIKKFSYQVERNREVLLGTLGHDLRTPLAAIQNSAYALLLEEDGSNKHAKLATRILRSVKRIDSMVSDLLDVMRTRLGGSLSLKPRFVNLRQICENVIEEVETQNADRKVHLKTSGNLGGEWDESRLAQLLSNLLTNAIQHGKEGSPVTIFLSAKDETVQIGVHNEGAVAPDVDLGRLFEPFVGLRDRQGTRGSGLNMGLYIAKEIARSHGGAIEVRSSTEEGTTFTVELPKRVPPELKKEEDH